MKKKIVVSIVLVTIGLISFLLTPDGYYYYLMSQWVIGKPDTYYMKILVRDNYEESRWGVIVQNDDVVDVTFLDGRKGGNWLHRNNFTVEDILNAGRYYCFPFECQIDVDTTYDYPRILVFEGRGVVIYEFRTCTAIEDCKATQ